MTTEGGAKSFPVGAILCTQNHHFHFVRHNNSGKIRPLCVMLGFGTGRVLYPPVGQAAWIAEWCGAAPAAKRSNLWEGKETEMRKIMMLLLLLFVFASLTGCMGMHWIH